MPRHEGALPARPPVDRGAVMAKMREVVCGRRPTTAVPDRIRFWIGWGAAIAALATLGFLLATGVQQTASPYKAVALVLLVGWTVLPPMFFWFDNFVLWRIEKQKNATQFESMDEFKHGQESSRNLWLALVALLAGIYFH